MTDEMLALGREMMASFAVIGLFEALFLPCLFFAVSNLPGALLPVLTQSMILWNFALSVILLKKTCDRLLLATLGRDVERWCSLSLSASPFP